MDQQSNGSFCGTEEHLEDENDQQENKDTHFEEQRTEHILLYAAEFWKVTKGICYMLEVFQNKWNNLSCLVEEVQELCTSFVEGSRWGWGQVAMLTSGRTRWRSSVSALWASTHGED